MSARPDYTVKIAETKDEVEACYDLRIEGERQIVSNCAFPDVDECSFPY